MRVSQVRVTHTDREGFSDLYVVGLCEADELEAGELGGSSRKPSEARCQALGRTVGLIHCLSSMAVKVGKAAVHSDCQMLSC